ncbi:hypothetical protein HJC23_010869 [Cyclotella cryptica]|uniref:sn-1-specific diacylglycerol lipase n=1 Tax=Cyclotella cryptica TaxID=29204 RepID=A0ABD3QNY5_9STRA
MEPADLPLFSSGSSQSFVMSRHYDDEFDFAHLLCPLNEMSPTEETEETIPQAKSDLFSVVYSPRGGGMSREDQHNTGQEAMLAPSTSAEAPQSAAEKRSKQQRQTTSVTAIKESCPQSQPQKMLWISPKLLWSAARKVIDSTTGMPGFRNVSSYTEDTQIGSRKDHKFAELDSIIENSSTTNHLKDNQRWLDDTKWFASETSPPKEASTLKGCNKHSLRSWMNKFSETAQAIKTIRKILESFPKYGVVDLIGLYLPKDVILSIISLSRVQRVVKYVNSRDSSNANATVDSVDNASPIEREMLDDLARYAKFAHAAYGWKGLAAFCGKLHFGGDYHALMKRTGIHRRDILMANWHSRTNRLAFFLVDDVERKAIFLSVRGTMSPCDILTYLYVSCENFFVEDKSDIVEIGDIEHDNDEVSPNSTLSPIIVARAHKGMVDAATSISKMTGKIITDELRSKKDYLLIILGHSLGGGVAGHLADITKALSQLCQEKSFRKEILQRTCFGKLSSLRDIPKSDLLFSECNELFTQAYGIRETVSTRENIPHGWVVV